MTQRNAIVSAPTRRRGFTLIELMIVVSLLGIIGTMLTAVLVRQQRFHRAVANLADARARMRDVATIIPTDLRGVSTAGKDILAISDTSIQFRAFIGASVMCRYASGSIIELPPKTLAPTTAWNNATTNVPQPAVSVLTAWINPPAPDDIVYLYNNGAQAGNVDDTWQPYKITDTLSAVDPAICPITTTPAYTTTGDLLARRYQLTLSNGLLSGAAPNQAQSPTGSPIRFAREVRYSIYKASDDAWYVGYERCTPNLTYGALGECNDREVLAGPVLPGTSSVTTSGLYFLFYNKLGNQITTISATDTIARVEVGIRTTSESLLKATTKTGGDLTGGDSLKFTVGIRNRV